ncbi:ficolin-2-like isoform X1 [Apostichopus japonicus]|uniref:ficolin-2-like isoform X1 n=1 Tax=Stichopus japonicus TaxID=307972 RepID=UPI003AB49860
MATQWRSFRFGAILTTLIYLCSIVESMDLCTFEEVSSCKMAENCSFGNYAAEETLETTPSQEIALSTQSQCPTNMVFGNCSCHGTCSDPFGCHGICEEPETCFCPPDNFLMDGEDCVPIEECECYIQDVGFLQPGKFFVNNDCTQRCNCTLGNLTCDHEYRCSNYASCQPDNGSNICSCNGGYYGDGLTCTLALDCDDYRNAGFTENGTYIITPTNWTSGPFEVYCDMNTSGGGWMVFQRRIDGSVDFYLNWTDYKEGFGNVDHEHWLGNDKLHLLTNQRDYNLRVDMISSLDGLNYYAEYELFRIANEDNLYRLTDLDGYSGNTEGNAMEWDIQSAWSTKDRDNGQHTEVHGECAVKGHGAYWYSVCGDFNPNGLYNGSGSASLFWEDIPGNNFNNIQFLEMKIRPARF